MNRICILTQSHLCRNPRVLKEASSLARAGYEVMVLTTFISQALYNEDVKLLHSENFKYCAAADLRIEEASKFHRISIKLQRRFAIELIKRVKVETPLALGYGLNKLYSKAKSYNADLYIAHQEMPTYVGYKLLNEGKKVAFDLEDWYSEDLLPEARRHRPMSLLKKIELNALSRGVFTVTTSNAMAQAMASKYRLPKPSVIYNAFSLQEIKKKDGVYKDRVNQSRPSLFWFSQTIGKGRGLELLCSALHFVDQPIELHLRGYSSNAFQHELMKIIPMRHTVFFHALVHPNEILSRIAEHTIGLALEPNEPDNKQYTISNKILHYLLAGLPVIASDTEGQREVAEMAPKAVALFRNSDAQSLAKCINDWLNHPEYLEIARKASQMAIEETFCWEKQAPKLLRLVEEALYNKKFS